MTTQDLFNACIEGNILRVQELYDLGINIHARNDEAFRLACKNAHIEIVKLLLNIGNIDIHAENEYAFRYVCLNGHIEIVKLLLSIDKLTSFNLPSDIDPLLHKQIALYRPLKTLIAIRSFQRTKKAVLTLQKYFRFQHPSFPFITQM